MIQDNTNFKYVFKIEDFDPFGTNKCQLSRIFKLTRRTILDYHSFAIDNCIEFIKDYPLIEEDRFTQLPLTPYQCWVIYSIYGWVHVSRFPKKLLSSLLEKESYQDKISKQQFLNTFYNQQNKEENNEVTELCRV